MSDRQSGHNYSQITGAAATAIHAGDYYSSRQIFMLDNQSLNLESLKQQLTLARRRLKEAEEQVSTLEVIIAALENRPDPRENTQMSGIDNVTHRSSGEYSPLLLLPPLSLVEHTSISGHRTPGNNDVNPSDPYSSFPPPPPSLLQGESRLPIPPSISDLPATRRSQSPTSATTLMIIKFQITSNKGARYGGIVAYVSGSFTDEIESMEYRWPTSDAKILPFDPWMNLEFPRGQFRFRVRLKPGRGWLPLGGRDIYKTVRLSARDVGDVVYVLNGDPYF